MPRRESCDFEEEKDKDKTKECFWKEKHVLIFIILEKKLSSSINP